MRFPPLIEFYGIDLVLAWLNNKCGWKVHRELFLLLRKYKLLSVCRGQLERNCLIPPTVPILPDGLWSSRNIRNNNVELIGLFLAIVIPPIPGTMEREN